MSFNGRLDQVQERISDVKDKNFEVTRSDKREQIFLKMEKACET